MHKMLERQLARLSLDGDTIPSSASSWQDFLTRVDNAYLEADNDRYLLQRSMELSSQELYEVNEKLENAQRIAGMGYWFYDEKQDIVVMSLGLREMLGLPFDRPIPLGEELRKLVHEDDRDDVRRILLAQDADEEDVSLEFRMIHPTKGMRWYHTLCRPYLDKKDKRTKISGVMMDITSRKESEEKVNKLNEQLVQTARLAGMADIASSILHNVGNVLNSVVVSLEVLKDTITTSKSSKFVDVFQLITDHMDDIQTYLQKDEKGRLIPQYIQSLSLNVKKEHQSCLSEIETLVGLVNHIKDIVASQNSLSYTRAVEETIYSVSLLENAVKMAGTADYVNKGVTINQCVGFNKKICVDQVKVMQILINLIHNAKESVLTNDLSKGRLIKITMDEVSDEGTFFIAVEDNGHGMSAETLEKLFNFGFTTKPNGHGFGLHASVLAAKEMGGSLVATSEGPGKGVCFKLTLPLVCPS